MKIFAKRTKKAASAAAPKERTSFASDPLVEELLTKDPKEWNAKQRRMVKRYQERKAEHQADSVDEKKVEKDDGTEKIGNDKLETATTVDADKESADSSDNANNDSDSSDSESQGDSDSDDNDDADESNQAEENSEKEIAQPEVSTTVVPAKQTSSVTQEDGKVDPTHEIFKLLDQLNSKMKRTLSRRLDREGVTALPEVQAEVDKLLGKSNEQTASKKRSADDAGAKSSNPGSDEVPKSKKARKAELKLSSLSPEERLRREEQRRKQKEAAERRASGEDLTPGYKHPLNSERRRANRRKPRWKNGSSQSGTKSVKTEHNSSGFQLRKRG